MKPARSPQDTATLPTFSHRASTVSRTSSPVLTVDTTSTSFMTGAGLKKCIPTTSCGRVVAVAHAMIGRLLVVVAKMAPGLQISSRFSKSVVFTARSSAIASTTRSASERWSRLVVPVSRPSTSGLTDSSSLPRWIALSRERSTVARTPSTLASVRPTYKTSYPALAKTSTMPVAIVPVPTTPIREIGRTSCALSSALRRVGVGDHDRAVRVLVGVEATPVLRPRKPAVTSCLSIGVGACSRSRPCLYIVSRIS